MYSFSYLEPVCCSISSSNCCFLACIQVSQEAGQVVWYSHPFQNFPQFIVIPHQGFVIVNKSEIDAFLELSCFFQDPADVGNLISGSSAFSKTSIFLTSNLYSSFCFIQPGILHDVLCIEDKWAGWQYTPLMYSFTSFASLSFHAWF